MLRKYRWSKAYESQEEELIGLLTAKNIKADRIELFPDEQTMPRTPDRETVYRCADGSCIFTINGVTTSIQPGDTITIAAYELYEITAGMMGCVLYLEKRP